jgi:Tol biopolymer transport system component
MRTQVSSTAPAASIATVMILATALLQGCTAPGSSAQSGIYVVSGASDAPGWIAEPAGIPVWSPDGRELAWATEDGLMVASVESGQTSVLAQRPVLGRPAWSPAGDAIAFVDEGSASLVVVESSTGRSLLEAPIATDSVDQEAKELLAFGGPSWSPDGDRLAFVCWDGHGDELCVMNSDGSGTRTITKLEPAPGIPGAASSNAGPPAWSPDGATIAVAAYPERRGAAAGVFLIDLEQGTARRLSKLLPNSEISWTADGASLVFSALEKGRSDVWRIAVDSSESSKLTADLPRGGRSPALSADSKELVVASGGMIVVLNGTDVDRQVEIQGLRGIAPTWSPSGEIAFAAVPNPLQTYD